MVEFSSPDLDRAFQALADPTRRLILKRLCQGEASVGDLAEPFQMSLAAVSKHLKVLEKAQLIEQTRVGRQRICVLRRQPFKNLSEVVHHYEHFWTERLEALDNFLSSPQMQSRSSENSKKMQKDKQR